MWFFNGPFHIFWSTFLDDGIQGWPVNIRNVSLPPCYSLFWRQCFGKQQYLVGFGNRVFNMSLDIISMRRPAGRENHIQDQIMPEKKKCFIGLTPATSAILDTKHWSVLLGTQQRLWPPLFYLYPLLHWGHCYVGQQNRLHWTMSLDNYKLVTGQWYIFSQR